MNRYFHIVKDGRVVGSLGETPGTISSPAYAPWARPIWRSYSLAIHNADDDVRMAKAGVAELSSASEVMTKLEALGYSLIERTMSKDEFDRVDKAVRDENAKRAGESA